jgi:hypothetical protein
MNKFSQKLDDILCRIVGIPTDKEIKMKLKKEYETIIDQKTDRICSIHNKRIFKGLDCPDCWDKKVREILKTKLNETTN